MPDTVLMYPLRAMPRPLSRDSIRNQMFLDIMNGPNPLTSDEIRYLAVKHPERWGAYVRYADAMDNARQRVA
jgi:hypothetical protein